MVHKQVLWFFVWTFVRNAQVKLRTYLHWSMGDWCGDYLCHFFFNSDGRYSFICTGFFEPSEIPFTHCSTHVSIFADVIGLLWLSNDVLQHQTVVQCHDAVGIRLLTTSLHVIPFSDYCMNSGSNTADSHNFFAYERVDVRAVEAGDLVAGQPITIEPAIEVANIFQLGTRYAQAMGAPYLDEQG